MYIFCFEMQIIYVQGFPLFAKVRDNMFCELIAEKTPLEFAEK